MTKLIIDKEVRKFIKCKKSIYMKVGNKYLVKWSYREVNSNYEGKKKMKIVLKDGVRKEEPRITTETTCSIINLETNLQLWCGVVTRFYKDEPSKEKARLASLREATKYATKEDKKLFWDTYKKRNNGETGIPRTN